MKSIFENILSLNRAPTKYGKAPHKPILLLAVIESFENREIAGNWIEISDNLLQRFHDIWNILVDTQNVPNFSLPFYHLKNEKGDFWSLIVYPGKEVPTNKNKSIKSFKALNETVAAAQLSNDLYAILKDSVERERLKTSILEKYFGRASYRLEQNIERYSQKLKKEILYEPEENYARNVLKQITALPQESREELVILRSSIFRTAILEIYDNQCSITGLKVEDENHNSLVDACHIIPFAKSYNDSIRNGIALSPTFHRAFDRGLIAISDDYRILVHPKIKDYHPETGIKPYHNRQISLPSDNRFYPSLESIHEHRIRFGFE
ncbi:MAG: HNH endonuclease [Bacteroidales bacterium]|nr:HNH endonuclease [Bacteroidales bacterium]